MTTGHLDQWGVFPNGGRPSTASRCDDDVGRSLRDLLQTILSGTEILNNPRCAPAARRTAAGAIRRASLDARRLLDRRLGRDLSED